MTVADGPVHLTRIVPNQFRLRGRRILGRVIRSLEYAAAVSRVLSELGPLDVIEFPSWNAEGFCYARRRRRCPVVTRVHSPFAEIAAAFNWRLTVDRRLAMALERTAVRRSEVVVTHSQYNARTAARGYGLDLARIPVIPHGIPIPPATSARQSDGFLRLLYVGRLELRKGIHVLLDALPEVLDAVPEAEVVIVGKDFPTAPGGRTWREHALASLSAAHQRRVCFLGYVDGETVERLYDGCDLFLAPSLYESFGLVYLEAMARSCAVVGSRTAAIPEVVAEGETGLLVPPGDAKALADAVITLCRDHAQRLEMGRRGRERVKQLFDERTMVDRVGALYEQTVRDR